MRKSKLIIFRGLPASGKSTQAQSLVPKGRDVAADDYFHTNFDRTTPYVFDGSKIPDAHQWCQSKVRSLLSDDTGLPVAVANTNTMRWEMQPYIDICNALGCEYEVIDLYDAGLTNEQLHARNSHGVPLEAFERMRARYEKDWQSASPMPPWLRGV